jgi:hypothetical protein
VNSRLADALPEQYRLERELGAGGMAIVYAARSAPRALERARRIG